MQGTRGTGQGGARKNPADSHCREGKKSVFPILPTLAAKSGRHYLPLLSTECATLEKILLKEVAKENRSFVLVGAERKGEAVPKLCCHRRLRRRIKQCLSDTSKTSKRAMRDMLSDMVRYDAALIWSSAVGDTPLLQKGEQMERAPEALLRKIEDADE